MASNGFANFSTDFGRSSKRDFIDSRMVYDDLAHSSVPGYDVDYSRGQARFLANFGKEKGGQRSVLGRLEDDRVAHRDCRGDLPGEHE